MTLRFLVASAVILTLGYVYLIKSGVDDYQSTINPVLGALHEESAKTVLLLEKIHEIHKLAVASATDCPNKTSRQQGKLQSVLLFNENSRMLSLAWEYRIAVPDKRFATTGWLFQGYRHGLVHDSFEEKPATGQSGVDGTLQLRRQGRHTDIWDYQPHPRAIEVASAWMFPAPEHIDASMFSALDSVAVVKPREVVMSGSYYDEWGKPVAEAYSLITRVCLFSYPSLELLEVYSIKTEAPFSKTWIPGRGDGSDQERSHSNAMYRFVRSKLRNPGPGIQGTNYAGYASDHEIIRQMMRDIRSRHERQGIDATPNRSNLPMVNFYSEFEVTGLEPGQPSARIVN